MGSFVQEKFEKHARLTSSLHTFVSNVIVVLVGELFNEYQENTADIYSNKVTW